MFGLIDDTFLMTTLSKCLSEETFLLIHSAMFSDNYKQLIYLNAKVSQPFYICVFFSMVQVKLFM